MHTRITEIVHRSGLTKTAFAKKIGLSQPFVSRMCAGDAVPSDRTIKDICEKFGVDRVWLETGVGEPFEPVSRNEVIAEILGQATNSNKTSRDRLIRAFCQLPDEMFEHAERILDEIIANLQKEKE